MISKLEKPTVAFVLAGIIVIYLGLVSYRSLHQLIQSYQWVNHSIDVRGNVEKISNTYISAQSSLRGYYITKDTVYLKQFSDEIDSLDAQIRQFSEQIGDFPKQVLEINNLKQLVEYRVDKIWSPFVLMIQADNKKELLKMTSNGSIAFANNTEILKSLSVLRLEEEISLKKKLDQLQLDKEESLALIIAGTVLVAFLVMGATWLMNIDQRKRRLAEEDLRRFFDVSVDMVAVASTDGMLRRISPSWTKTLGYTMEELYAVPFLNFIHPDDIEMTKNELAKQAQGIIAFSFENRFRCKDGSYKVISWQSAPYAGLLYASGRDVTTQKAFEAELVKDRLKSIAASKAKSELIANVSHEIRTPLNGVIGTVELLGRSSLSPQQKEWVRVIQSSGQTLLNIINEILDFSKLEAGKIKTEKVPFNIHDQVSHVIALFSPLAQQKGLKLELHFDSSIIREKIVGDPTRLQQILTNLLSNALKFTEKGSVSLGVYLVSRDSKALRLRFLVSETGIGMSESQKAVGGEPFSQADISTERRYGGTGLGLSISKRLVESLGGVIGFDSIEGAGSNFYFEVGFDFFNEQELPNLNPTPQGSTTKNQALKILLVEDNQTNCLIAKAMLDQMGHVVKIAENGKEAIDIYLEDKFDLVIMDHQMPVMGGMESVIRIRQQETLAKKKACKILGFTASVNLSDEGQQFASLVDGMIYKPVTFESMSQAIRNLHIEG